jgi:dephospho-CoA kinase
LIVAGLTGSIGMGKSTTATMFANEGIPVHDADRAVHLLYEGRAAPLVEAAFPGTVTDGRVDREKLGRHVIGKPDAMKRLEAIVHPLVREEEQRFLRDARAAGARLVILDIPLLFETGRDKGMDAVIVVTADADVQRKRVLARPGMTDEKFRAILAKQTPDAEKRAKAGYLIDTGHGFDAARARVREIIDDLHAKSR